jgi:hypothetical protein
MRTITEKFLPPGKPFEDCYSSIGVNIAGADFMLALGRLGDECEVMASALDKEHDRLSLNTRGHDFAGQLIVYNAFDKARKFRRVSNDIDYIRATRFDALPPEANLTFFVDETGHDHFVRLAKGQNYSLDALAQSRDWFENAADACRRHIPVKQVRAAAQAYYDTKIEDILKRQSSDTFKQASVLDTLESVPFGAEINAHMRKAGNECRFVDLKPYNNFQRDLREHRAIGVCYGDGLMLIDYGLDNVTAALKWAHEIGHNYQHEADKIADTRAVAAGTVIIEPSDHPSTREGHSIAFEYILAAQLLRAGYDKNAVHAALYGFPGGTVNHLLDNPEAFIDEASRSDVVRERWSFKKKEMKPSAELAARYAATIPALCAPWQELSKRAAMDDFIREHVRDIPPRPLGNIVRGEIQYIQ